MIPVYQNSALDELNRAKRRVIKTLTKAYSNSEDVVIDGGTDKTMEASLDYKQLEKKLMVFISLALEAKADIEDEEDQNSNGHHPPASFDPGNNDDDDDDDDDFHDPRGGEDDDDDNAENYLRRKLSKRKRADNHDDGEQPVSKRMKPSTTEDRDANRMRSPDERRRPRTTTRVFVSPRRARNRNFGDDHWYDPSRPFTTVPSPSPIHHEIYRGNNDGQFSAPNPSRNHRKKKALPEVYGRETENPFKKPRIVPRRAPAPVLRNPLTRHEEAIQRQVDRDDSVYEDLKRQKVYHQNGPFSDSNRRSYVSSGRRRNPPLSGGAVKHSGAFAGILKTMINVGAEIDNLVDEMATTFNFLNKMQVARISQLLTRGSLEMSEIVNLFDNLVVHRNAFNRATKENMLTELSDGFTGMYDRLQYMIISYSPAVIPISTFSGASRVEDD
jgi:hypothetical protein